MKWGGGGGSVGVAGSMRGGLLVAVVVVLLQLSWSGAVVGGDSPIEVFVPGAVGLDVGTVYRLTVRGGDVRAAFVLCCEAVAEQVAFHGGVSGNRSVEVECSYGAAGESFEYGVGDLASGGGGCLLVDSSLGGGGTGVRGKMQLDSTLAFSAFLGWVSRNGSAVDEMQVSLRTQPGKCSRSVEGSNHHCQLAVTSSILSAADIPTSLASVEIERRIYSEMQLTTPREFNATMRLVSKLPSTRSGADSARSSNGSAFLRGLSNSLDSNRTGNSQELYLVILSDTREDRGYGGVRTRSARNRYLGRRLLRVSN